MEKAITYFEKPGIENTDALIELVNLHDDSLEFEAIHRIVTNANTDELMSEMTTTLGLSEEKAEQAVLRREYIDSFKMSLVGQLENTYIVDEKGNKTKVTRKPKKK